MTDLEQPDSILPPAETPSPPRAWVAVLLSLLFPGLGHAVRGRWQRALGWTVVSFACIPFVVRWPFWPMVLLCALLRIAIAVDAARTPPIDPPPSGGLAFMLALVLLGLQLCGAFVVRRTVVEAFKIPAGSMLPTLEVGDHVFVSKLRHVPERGDVIVFHYPKEPAIDFVKRVIAVGGDTVELRKDEVILNGKPLPHEPLGDCEYDDYSEQEGGWQRRTCSARGEALNGHHYRVFYDRGAERASFPPVKVPPDSFYVLGDNRDNSHDSRYWGFVPRALVVGRVESVWFSSGPNGVRWERLQQRVR
jgi:signal peptidase I